jgi:predicted transposase/invertase (TIGR01784 family)
MYIDHDRLFKELIETFFAEFMELFYPAAYQAIDFAHLKFLQQEVFTDVTAGEKHKVDLLIETKLKGEESLILLHVEPQGYAQKDFNERMFIYFSRLHEKYRRKILPISIFTYDQVRDEPDRFEIGFTFLEVLRFCFYKLELKKLSWREYILSDNPVAAALLSKMGFKEDEKVQVKLEFMRILARLKLDPARMELIGGFFETYLKLNREEEEEFYRELGRIDEKEVQAIMQITTTWHEKGRTEGIAEGRTEGIAEGRAEETRTIILEFLEHRFGEQPLGVAVKLKEIRQLEQLQKIRLEIFKASSLEEALAIILRAAN